jgi:hypothetical protein
MNNKLRSLTAVLLLVSCLLASVAWIQIAIQSPTSQLHYFVATPFFFILIACIVLKVQKTGVIDSTYAILNRPVSVLVKKISSLSVIGTSFVVTGSLMVLFSQRMKK